MSTRSNSSRERILDCAQGIILKKGFAGTSIDDILEKAAITKGGFFYHFDGKSGLASALVQRYLEQDDAIFSELFRQADDLSEDPLHQLLIFLKLLAEMMGQLEETHPGCLVVSFTYESYQFDDDIRKLIQQGILSWRKMIVDRLNVITEKYAARGDTNINALADMFISTIEGGIILSLAFRDKQLLVDQILTYRNCIRLIYEA
ncbi:MAG: TetR/AcrR family transcriptional regulator [Gammaproteobacteria bacterium]|nr:TetR/AcrR family transcriptional regulator [Gammaproteobacteria bacterium]